MQCQCSCIYIYIYLQIERERWKVMGGWRWRTYLLILWILCKLCTSLLSQLTNPLPNAISWVIATNYVTVVCHLFLLCIQMQKLLNLQYEWYGNATKSVAESYVYVCMHVLLKITCMMMHGTILCFVVLTGQLKLLVKCWRILVQLSYFSSFGSKPSKKPRRWERVSSKYTFFKSTTRRWWSSHI